MGQIIRSLVKLFYRIISYRNHPLRVSVCVSVIAPTVAILNKI